MFVVWIFTIATYAAIFAAVVALALALLKRWTLARSIARAATIVALTTLFLSVVVLVLILVVPSVGALLFRSMLPDGSPTDRARFLAEAIAETLNSSAMAVPTLLLTIPIWIIARLKLKKLAAQGAGGGPITS